MKKTAEKIYKKFKLKGSFELNTSKSDFISHFRKNVDYEKLDFFTTPIQKKTENKYVGNINENNFILKKIWKNETGPHLEICKGEIIEIGKKLKVNFEINGLQGFFLIILLIFTIVGIAFLSGPMFEKNFNENGASYIFFIIAIIWSLLFYKLFIREMIENIMELKENLEIDIKNWFRI
jgi:hypothetical protein